MDEYSAEIEQKMQRFFGWLSEKDRRRYAAVEAAKLGHGGVEYIARVLGCDPQTIRQGLRDLEEEEDAAAGAHPKKGVDARRAPSHSRPSKRTSATCCRSSPLGNPMRAGVLWTNLSLRELSRRLLALGTPASRRTIRRLLRKLKLGQRTARRKRRWATIPTATPNLKTSRACGASMRRPAMP